MPVLYQCILCWVEVLIAAEKVINTFLVP